MCITDAVFITHYALYEYYFGVIVPLASYTKNEETKCLLKCNIKHFSLRECTNAIFDL